MSQSKHTPNKHEQYLIDNGFPICDHNLDMVRNGTLDNLMFGPELENAMHDMSQERAEQNEVYND